ncbi:MarR family transcriptional regulator [Nonomuraea sp. NPDC046802]|uniref:GbsR/MarR family transcriptional regulator n=1 Tax=Nonomuraea sp. NPDC046802 TaxID=3154919 RepID=UPI0033EF4E50
MGRNGGYDGYRADTAQQATRQRARRVQESRAEPRSPAVRDFEEQFAAMMARSGLPRMSAKVLVCLLTSEHGSLAAAELIHRLKVSPASVSKAVAYLEQIGLIRRERVRRRERYFIDDDTWYEACLGVVQMCATWADSAGRGAELFDGTPAGTRLDEMRQYFEHVGQGTARAAEQWRQALAAQRPPAQTMAT